MPTVKGDPEGWLNQFRQAGLEPKEASARPPAGAPTVKKKRGRPEYEFQKAVIELARLRGWLCAHFRAVPVRDKSGRVYHQTPVDADGAGFPDLILLRRERMIAAELKCGSNKPSPEQEKWLSAFHAAAFVEVFVWHPDLWQQIEKELR